MRRGRFYGLYDDLIKQIIILWNSVTISAAKFGACGQLNGILYGRRSEVRNDAVEVNKLGLIGFFLCLRSLISFLALKK